MVDPLRLPRKRSEHTHAQEHPVGSRLRVPVERAVDRCRVIHQGRELNQEFSYENALHYATEHEDCYVLLELSEPDEQQMEHIAAIYGVDELIVEDTVTAHQRPKVERYDDQLFFVLRTVVYQEHERVRDAKEIIQTGELQMILGPNFIIAIRHGVLTGLKRWRRELSEWSEQLELGPVALAWQLSDLVVNEYVRIAGELTTDVDEIEEEVFTPNSPIDISQIYMLKREILEMRHSVDPLSTALRILTQNHKDVLTKPLRSYFRDVLDNQLIAADSIASLDERLTALIDAAVAKVTMQQNSDMRKISALVGMAALPTMIAGVYGMNFDHMPELHYEYGYYVVLGVMIAAVVLMWWVLKKNHWL